MKIGDKEITGLREFWAHKETLSLGFGAWILCCVFLSPLMGWLAVRVVGDSPEWGAYVFLVVWIVVPAIVAWFLVTGIAVLDAVLRQDERSLSSTRARTRRPLISPSVIRVVSERRKKEEELRRQAQEERRKRQEQREEERRRQERERQEQIEALLQRDVFRESIDYMNGAEFERFMAGVFDKKGYPVQLTPASGDQGVDLLLTTGGRSYPHRTGAPPSNSKEARTSE